MQAKHRFRQQVDLLPRALVDKFLSQTGLAISPLVRVIVGSNENQKGNSLCPTTAAC
jgi:hypothetical protein